MNIKKATENSVLHFQCYFDENMLLISGYLILEYSMSLQVLVHPTVLYFRACTSHNQLILKSAQLTHFLLSVFIIDV